MQGSDLILKTGEFASRMARFLSSFTTNELQQLGFQYNHYDEDELLRVLIRHYEVHKVTKKRAYCQVWDALDWLRLDSQRTFYRGATTRGADTAPEE